MDYKAKLIQLLGLDADASDDLITAAAADFQTDMVEYKENSDTEIANSKKAIEEKDEELANRATEVVALTAKTTKLTEELVNRDMEVFADVISNKDAVKANLLSNRDSGLAVLNAMKKPEPSASKPPMHVSNREVPAPSVADGVDQDAARAKRVSNRAREIKANTGVSFSAAFVMAQAETPTA